MKRKRAQDSIELKTNVDLRIQPLSMTTIRISSQMRLPKNVLRPNPSKGQQSPDTASPHSWMTNYNGSIGGANEHDFTGSRV